MLLWQFLHRMFVIFHSFAFLVMNFCYLVFWMFCCGILSTITKSRPFLTSETHRNFKSTGTLDLIHCRYYQRPGKPTRDKERKHETDWPNNIAGCWVAWTHLKTKAGYIAAGRRQDMRVLLFSTRSTWSDQPTNGRMDRASPQLRSLLLSKLLWWSSDWEKNRRKDL